MNFVRCLDEILGSRSKLSILRALSDGRALTGRQVALELKLAVWACHRTLRELVNLGVLELVNQGRSYLYRMNRDSYLAREALLPLFAKEGGALKNYLDRVLASIQPYLTSAVLFGSVGRGDEMSFSGIDLLLILPTPAEKQKVRELLEDLRLTLLLEFGGNLLTPYLLTEQELRQKMEEPLLKKIQGEGRLIFGKGLADASRSAPQNHS